MMDEASLKDSYTKNYKIINKQKTSQNLLHIKKCLEKHFIFYNLSDQEL